MGFALIKGRNVPSSTVRRYVSGDVHEEVEEVASTDEEIEALLVVLCQVGNHDGHDACDSLILKCQ